jgi:acetyltransferase-like isoleucine patch superfamily enzyme
LKPIISPNIRVRHPAHFRVEEGSIVDDFCYFSTKVFIGRWSHVASGCSVAGGFDRTFTLGDYSSVSSGVRIWCTSDDFVNDVVTILPAGMPQVKEHEISGDVSLASFTAVGSNSVVMPDNRIPEGTVIGALSFVPAGYAFAAWSVYAGVPIRLLRPRNEARVRAQVERIESFLRQKALEE